MVLLGTLRTQFDLPPAQRQAVVASFDVRGHLSFRVKTQNVYGVHIRDAMSSTMPLDHLRDNKVDFIVHAFTYAFRLGMAKSDDNLFALRHAVARASKDQAADDMRGTWLVTRFDGVV
ncbi:hypothetical protein GGTG_02583 [Gaeumannomyces tritici R3-111a-1]|uniref:Uncharacterized protein n=1 Tax=Gaeumannomyces tritici (strain R3-111a-1) TaxID=644352 RepID=J3NMS7_GAET3|nr:hypothetical protein GGTG_02583 [Gaeumannomyces tritici R3-111a-1]EJT77474.1 hypothetical protein GGTG_02583 [Gaeumannomyces tritici R3-111a-1]